MSCIIQSILAHGADGLIVDIECQLSNGLPSVIMVGLGNKAVTEAKERIRAAFTSTRIPFPKKRITINLAPADIPKDSTSLDLAIAASIMTAGQQLEEPVKHQALIGEIGLDGTIRPVRGIIGIILAGQKIGITTYLLPRANARQAALIPGITIHPLQNIRELYDSLVTKQALPVPQPETYQETAAMADTYYWSEIIGQEHAKRAAEIAAAGGHNMLLHGPPGTGKSMLAKAMSHILPALSHREILEVTHLHSLVDYQYDRLITVRPFRSPHHSSSYISIVGGGSAVRPGEITLSHRGILFLDELPEFPRSTLEALRQPLEDRIITISRAKLTTRYPAAFILVATANPCPCGYYGTPIACHCTAAQIHAYQQRLSGPILDRIDLFANVDMPKHTALLPAELRQQPDQNMKTRIAGARKRQQERYGSDLLNAHLDNRTIRLTARLGNKSRQLLNTAADRLNLSGRSYIKLVKVARTIADLDGDDVITPAHISEALQYRQITSR